MMIIIHLAQVGLSYSPESDTVTVCMYKCRLHHQPRDHGGLYLKTSLHQRGGGRKTRTCRAIADRRVLDFSQEHTFRLERGKAFSVLMQVKRSQGIGKKSECQITDWVLGMLFVVGGVISLLPLYFSNSYGLG